MRSVLRRNGNTEVLFLHEAYAGFAHNVFYVFKSAVFDSAGTTAYSETVALNFKRGKGEHAHEFAV